MSVFKGEVRYLSASSSRKHRANSKKYCAFFGNTSKENHEHSSSSNGERSTDNKVAIDRQGDKRGFRPF